MRIILAILALFVMGLTALPCVDVYAHSTHEELASEIHTAHSQFDDDCSPFCACQCCQVQVAEYDYTFVQTPIKLEIPTTVFHYESPDGMEIKTPLFQPPRV